MRDSDAALGSRPAIMHALRSVLRVCSVSEAPGATVTTTTVRALAAGVASLGLDRESRLGALLLRGLALVLQCAAHDQDEQKLSWMVWQHSC